MFLPPDLRLCVELRILCLHSFLNEHIGTLGLQLPGPGDKLDSYCTLSRQEILSWWGIFLEARAFFYFYSSFRLFITLQVPGAGLFSFFQYLIISSRNVSLLGYLIFNLLAKDPHYSQTLYLPGPGTIFRILVSSSRKFPLFNTRFLSFSPFLILRNYLCCIYLRGSKYFLSTQQPEMPCPTL